MKIMPVAVPLQTTAVSAPRGQLVKDGPAADETSFKEIFDKALQNLNESQLKAEETVKKFLTGEITDVHTVMIALEEAKLTMQLAVEVRNKIVEAYQELSRMQV